MADNRQAGSLWSPEEDVILLRHVAKYGTKHWGYLQTSGTLPHRDQKACCNRFILLKRKFFQARAKGQRLTFPVVPQPETSNSSKQHHSLNRPTSNTHFKKSPRSFGTATSSMFYDHRSVSDASDEEKGSSGFEVEKSAVFQREVDSLPTRYAHQTTPIINTQFQARIDSVTKMSPKTRLTAKSEVVESYGMPALVEAPKPETHQNPPVIADNLDATPQALSLPSSQAAAWRCFNPAMLDVAFPDFTGADSLGNLPNGFLSENLRDSMAPDALLDQIATAPVRMLCGQQASVASTESQVDAQFYAEGAAWQSTSACLDLWDLLGTPAPV